MDYALLLLVVFLIAILGAVLTSYFGVLIQRGFRQSLLERSRCDYCGRRLGLFELIPVFSSLYWAISPTGSSCCRKKIPLTYFWTELYGAVFGGVAGILIYKLFSIEGITQTALRELQQLSTVLPTVGLVVLAFAAALLISLLFSAVEDFWLLSIDIRIPVIAIATSSLVIALLQQLQVSSFEILGSLASGWLGALAVILLIVFSRGRGLGSGDIYWFFFVGLTLGVTGLLITAVLTIFSAAFAGIIFAIYKKRLKGEIIPLVPFILLSWFITLTFYQDILATWQKFLYV